MIRIHFIQIISNSLWPLLVVEVEGANFFLIYLFDCVIILIQILAFFTERLLFF